MMDSVRSFIRDQQSYSTYYAKLGEKDRKRTPDATMPSPSQTALLKTPVLKPRAPLCKATSKERVGKGSACIINDSPSREPLRVSERRARKGIMQDTDAQRANLLQDRKGKRREKRDILKGLNADSIGRNDIGSTNQAVGTSKPVKDVHLPLGLALMESFASKSINKERITLRPNASKGVFNKGKASVQTRANRIFKKGTHSLFEEAQFLEKSAKLASSNQLSAASSHPLSTETNISPDVSKNFDAKRSNYFRARRFESKQDLTHDLSQSSKQDDSFETKNTRIIRERVSSPVWDIETGNELPEDDITALTCPPRMKESQSRVNEVTSNAIRKIENQVRRPSSPSSSLRPSQSASHVPSLTPVPLCSSSKRRSRLPLLREASPNLTVLERDVRQVLPSYAPLLAKTKEVDKWPVSALESRQENAESGLAYEDCQILQPQDSHAFRGEKRQQPADYQCPTNLHVDYEGTYSVNACAGYESLVSYDAASEYEYNTLEYSMVEDQDTCSAVSAFTSEQLDPIGILNDSESQNGTVIYELLDVDDALEIEVDPEDSYLDGIYGLGSGRDAFEDSIMLSPCSESESSSNASCDSNVPQTMGMCGHIKFTGFGLTGGMRTDVLRESRISAEREVEANLKDHWRPQQH